MALSSLKYSLGLSAIKKWDSTQKTFYEKVWKNEEKFYTYVGVLCGALILIGLVLLIGFSGAAGSSSTIKFDPYDVLGLTDKNCTDRDVKSQFRKLSRTMHPDRNTVDEPEVAKEKYLQIKESQDILLNPKRRKNFDEHGDPDWVDLFDYETYPDILMNPGKPFVMYTTLIALLFGGVLPLSYFILHPALEDPPEWLTEVIFEAIKRAENDLSSENLESCLETLKEADELWGVLIKSFPAYRKSVWCVLIEIRIACRRAQCQLFKASHMKLNSKEFQDLIKETTQMMKTTKDLNNTVLKTSQTRKETFAVIQPYLKDVKNMIDNTELRGNIRDLETLLTTF